MPQNSNFYEEIYICKSLSIRNHYYSRLCLGTESTVHRLATKVGQFSGEFCNTSSETHYWAKKFGENGYTKNIPTESLEKVFFDVYNFLLVILHAQNSWSIGRTVGFDKLWFFQKSRRRGYTIRFLRVILYWLYLSLSSYLFRFHFLGFYFCAYRILMLEIIFLACF